MNMEVVTRSASARCRQSNCRLSWPYWRPATADAFDELLRAEVATTERTFGPTDATSVVATEASILN